MIIYTPTKFRIEICGDIFMVDTKESSIDIIFDVIQPQQIYYGQDLSREVSQPMWF